MRDQIGIGLKIVWSVCRGSFWSIRSEKIVKEFGWQRDVFALDDEFVGLVSLGISQFQGNRGADGAVEQLHAVGGGFAPHVGAIDGYDNPIDLHAGAIRGATGEYHSNLRGPAAFVCPDADADIACLNSTAVR